MPGRAATTVAAATVAAAAVAASAKEFWSPADVSKSRVKNNKSFLRRRPARAFFSKKRPLA
jgi:hypothetical protein